MLFNPQNQILRAASDLAAGTAVTSDPISCFGAREVIFFCTATNGTVFDAASTIEVSMDGTNWYISSTTGSAVSALATMTTAAMNAGGTIAILVATSGNNQSTNNPIPWAFARLKNAGNATTIIPNLKIVGNVVVF